MAKRPSPDSVICIDLTESDDEREEKLGDVRKRLRGTPEATPIIKTERAASARGNDDQAMSIDDDGGGKIGSCAALQQKEWASEVEVVEPAAREIRALDATQTAATNDDVLVVGTANESRLPHMRQHCTENKFVQDIVALNRQSHMTASKRRELEEGRTGNVSFCDLCFCYVCDKPAKECASWSSTLFTSYASHCHACDTGTDAAIWKDLRVKAKNSAGRQAVSMQEAAAPPAPPAATQTLPGTGPYEPEDALAANDPNLTKCRKCGWYNGFDHCNFAKLRAKDKNLALACRPLHPVGFLDWCHSCGRVASEQDFGKVQAQPYTRKAGDVFLGEKTIPFTIVAHDPRKFTKYEKMWANHEGSGDPKWTFSESEMEEDVFKHRLGQYPTLEMILASIPIVPKDELPKSGSFYLKKDRRTWNERENYYGVPLPTSIFPTVSADETEAVIVENHNHKVLLEELFNFGTVGFKKKSSDSRTAMLDGDIAASWNATQRSGTLTVRIFLQPPSFQHPSLTKFVGTWFDIFPFSLAALSGPICARKPSESNDSRSIVSRCIGIPVPPFLLSPDKQKEVREKSADTLTVALKNHNKRVQANLARLSLNSSTKGELLGGVCSTETGLSGVLSRYCLETFAEDVDRVACVGNRQEFSWRNAFTHIVTTSGHREMRTAGTSIIPRPGMGDYRIIANGRDTHYESHIHQGDRVKVASMAYECSKLVKKTGSLKGLLEHLQNLHHSSVPFVEGLTVELLEFQRQSVQWALERETTPGGVQSFLWAKLPSVAEQGQELYFNPILERFRRDKPQLIRGGIIAEEMGLGKTVISLALILQNHAPAVPQSGSVITVLNSAANGASDGNVEQVSWDKGLYSRTSASNSKRGSILSRGTLVVCHVSLVGQWIDEAKSKLKDPGLVYPYHGQNRKRNAATLAQNSIVVTTYQTLASDATYHANKGGDGYCAPCEQVRWWRIICDESHCLREASTKRSLAIMNLVADHKWLVSGTPVNTTLNDLKNQLKFIGLENVDEMFRMFAATVFRHINDQRAKPMGRLDNRRFGHFVFLMRAIMIRHTQNQTYRGTTTTLMSLPPKVERTVEVQFSDNEKNRYAALDGAARKFYTEFKTAHGHKLSKYYLRLTQKLTQLRIAASGGRVPLDEGEYEEDPDDEDDSAEEPSSPKKTKPKKETRYSEFAYNSKVNALVAELKRARDEDPSSKSLVFSQFSSTLKWLQQELPKHGFQYRTLSGDMSMTKRAQALYDFQHDPPTTIFLLSLRAGAVGINLTQANRVLLMEPSFNPAVEAQAIGRVHRLGQKRNVEIVRLVMKDSIETRIHKMLEKKYGNLDPGAEGAAAAKPKAESLVGSIQFDKTKVLGKEFDILFGVSDGNAASASDDEEDDDGDNAMEPVTSASI